MWVLYDSGGWVVSEPFNSYWEAVYFLRAAYLLTRVVQHNPYIIRKMYDFNGLQHHIHRVMLNTEKKLALRE